MMVNSVVMIALSIVLATHVSKNSSLSSLDHDKINLPDNQVTLIMKTYIDANLLKEDPNLKPESFALNFDDYGGNSLAENWLGKTLGDFMLDYPDVFKIDETKMGKLVKGIKGSEKDYPWIDNADSYWWKISSSTHREQIENETTDDDDFGKDPNNSATTVGVSLLELKNYNVFWFTLCHFVPMFP
ncbi:DUF4430 domain-containing protein [Entomoplasma freundtii]|nr:DUF4430 domain-containing protein [Entomoplasma freundtii]